jgi:hypothetical protein
MKHITIDFLESFFIDNALPDYYNEFSCDYISSSNSKLHINNKIPELKNNIVVVKDVPSYLSVVTKTRSKNNKQKNITHYTGHAINFENVESTNTYLKSRFGNSSRYKLRRSIKKLEYAFDISYKMFYGEISQEDYEIIFDNFFKLLETRSIEKGILNNRNIIKKRFYYDRIKPLILKKQASFFVIYNKNTPIDICLNLHKDKMVFQLIRTYDINYSKYNTGYIDLIKQIDWCLLNGVEFMTFSHGSYYWKKRWCNYEYLYTYDIFYNKKSILSLANAAFETLHLKLRHYLREQGYINKFHEIKNTLKEKIKPIKSISANCETLDFTTNTTIDNVINIDTIKYRFLKHYVFDFLFNFNEKENDITVYTVKNKPNKYLIQGLNNKVLLHIKTH